MRIAPSILNADLLDLPRSLEMLEKEGASWLHFDVMDGQFVPNITFGPPFAEAVRSRTKLPMEAHLMINDPQKQVKAFADAGVNRLIVHYEGNPHIHYLLQSIRNAGMAPGVVINPGTPVEVVKEILPDVEILLLMTVNPGWGGQKFIRPVLEKVKRARTMIDALNLEIDLEVDGGVGPSTIRECADAGANLFVVGTAIFRAPDPGRALADLVAM